MPSSIPLALSSPLVTEKKDRFEHFFPFPMKKRATSTGVEIVPQDLTFGPEKRVLFQTPGRKSNQRPGGQKSGTTSRERVITLAFLISFCHNVHTRQSMQHVKYLLPSCLVFSMNLRCKECNAKAKLLLTLGIILGENTYCNAKVGQETIFVIFDYKNRVAETSRAPNAP